MTDLTFTADEQPKMSAFNERFSTLNQLYQYWWKRRYPAGDNYTGKVVDAAEDIEYFATRYTHNPRSRWVYSDSFEVDPQSGQISLINPQYTEWIAYGSDAASDVSQDANTYLLNKYFYIDVENSVGANSQTVYFLNTSLIRANITNGTDSYGAEKEKFSSVDVIYGQTSPGPWQYLFSSNRDAYPDSGESEGYEYQYLGVPFDSAVNAPQVATGSYVGTGTYGEDNPNSLTFDFEPKVFIFYGATDSNGTGVRAYDCSIVPFDYLTETYKAVYLDDGAATPSRCNMMKYSNHVLSWYYNDPNYGGASYQNNESGLTYYYAAIG